MSLDNINLEVTTICPLRCPQCYVNATQKRNMPFETAKYWIDEAKINNCKIVALSGGETLCYPHLFDVIQYTKNIGLYCAASFSGVGFTDDVYQHLVDVGIDEIHISLNGSTSEINSRTRDGYYEALKALSVIKRGKKNIVAINWVMHSCNCNDFPQLVQLAEEYSVDYIQIIGLKPDSKNELKSLPDAHQMTLIKKYIDEYQGNVKIIVERCYSQLRAMVYDRGFWGNYNLGKNKGCLAGHGAVSVNIDGLLSPCRHLKIYEKFNTISEYLKCSPVIKEIQQAEKKYNDPCNHCHYKNNCKHCIAANYCLKGTLTFGDTACPLAKLETNEY